MLALPQRYIRRISSVFVLCLLAKLTSECSWNTSGEIRAAPPWHRGLAKSTVGLTINSGPNCVAKHSPSTSSLMTKALGGKVKE